MIGSVRIGDPDFLAGMPRGALGLALQVAFSVLTGRPRSISRDALRFTRLLSPPPLVEGGEYVPASEPFVLVGNHHSPPGTWMGWVAAAVTAAVAERRAADAADLHWLVLAEYGRETEDGGWQANRLSGWLFARASRIWGMVTTPQRPGAIRERARALRQLIGYLRPSQCPAEPVALFPEGTGTQALGEAMPGSGALLLKLSKSGVPIVPLGIASDGKRLRLRFGPGFQLSQEPAGWRPDDWAREQTMRQLAALLPEAMRGRYSELATSPLETTLEAEQKT